MKLKPGQSGAVEFSLPPEIAEAVSRGARLTIEHGPMMETSPNHYERMVNILLEGETVGSMMISWDAEPLPWFRHIWNRLLRRPDPGPPDIRIDGSAV
jgi:hypothetical protein